jgi:hypothetical protein
MTSYLEKVKCDNYELPSNKYGTYYIIKEGFKTFTVEYSKQNIKIYLNEYLSEENKKENIILQKYLKQNKFYETTTQFGSGKDDDYIYFFPKIKLVKEIKKFSKVWLGFDTEYKFRSIKYIGNSILVKVSKDEYILFANNTISQFKCKYDIIKYYSPLDDETVSNPICLTKDKLLILIPFENTILVYNTKDIDKLVMSPDYKSLRNDKYSSKNSPEIYIIMYYNNNLKSIKLIDTIKTNNLIDVQF